ncbi:MAG: sigma-54 interaction domain-containing protein, partial [Chitinispirillaceae bacterium]
MNSARILVFEEKRSFVGCAVERLIGRLAPEGNSVKSTSLYPDTVSPAVIAFSLDEGLDLNACRNEIFQDVKDYDFDLIVAIGQKAKGVCPVFPGVPPVVTWSISDIKEISREQVRVKLKEIENIVSLFFRHDFWGVLEGQRKHLDHVLDSMKEGMIVHDLDRRILYFSKGAEMITGFRREEVLGRDCHKVIVPGFCGDKCSFCDNGNYEQMSSATYQTVFLDSCSRRHSIQITRVPIKNDQGVVTGVMAILSDETRVKELERKLGEAEEFSGIIGQDYKMLAIFDLIENLAQSDFSVIITGESGTGKELVAAAIHNESSRRDKGFVPINCGALPEGTLESELFGHVKGAFTGAIRDKKGRFELADGGTLFLDEIGEMPLNVQVKLLRILQEGSFMPVGSECVKKADVRIICATNRNLKEMVNQGRFREDLYYRLAVVPIEVPPLRERKNDIVLLVNHFLESLCGRLGRRRVRISDEALSVMMNYAWPGNIRQLQNALQFSLIKCRGEVIVPEHLPPEVCSQQASSSQNGNGSSRVGRKPKLTSQMVDDALGRTDGNKARAARILGVGRAT